MKEIVCVIVLLISMFTYWAIMMYALWDPKEPTQNKTNGAQK